MGEAKRKRKIPDEHRRKFLNDLCDRIDAFQAGRDPLAFVKYMIAEILKWPEATEAERIEVLTAMENGGYEALQQWLRTRKIPADFDPTDRPWNRN